MTIRTLFCTAALALSAIAFTAPAHAQTDNISERLGALTPYNGAYIDWNVGGVGMDWDSGPAGSSYGSIMTFHAYDADGNQINWTGQFQYQPATNAERFSSGVIGRASGELYLATDGPCIGCAPATPVITPTGIVARLEWSAPRTVTLTLTGNHTGTYHLTAVNYASVDDGAFLEGTWAATVYYDHANAGDAYAHDTIRASMAVIRLRRLPSATVLRDANAPEGTALPPESATFYLVECQPDENGAGATDRKACFQFFGLVGRSADPRTGSYPLAWYDPASGRAGLEAAKFETGAYVLGASVNGGSNITMHMDLYVQPRLIEGRGLGYNDSAGFRGVYSALTMVRVPDATVRNSYDYPSANSCSIVN